MTDQQSNLLPCPLCGGEMLYKEARCYGDPDIIEHSPVTGGYSCPLNEISNFNIDTDLITAWNTRKPDAFREDNGDKGRENPAEAPTNRNTDPIWQALWELAEAASGPHELSRGDMVDRAWRKVVGDGNFTTDDFFIDCEFDGHHGPLLSLAIVRGDGYSIHIKTTETANDNWVLENVVPLLDQHTANQSAYARTNDVGSIIRAFIGDCQEPSIHADSPVDIARFCSALSTSKAGGWESADYPKMNFVVHNVDCYPTELAGAVQHNAWWDAVALLTKLQSSTLTRIGAKDDR